MELNLLVDSDVMIAILRGWSPENERLHQELEDGVTLWFSAVTLTEVEAGMRPEEERATRALFQMMYGLDVTQAIGERAGQYLRRYGRSHAVSLPDALIGATASQHDFALWTRNRKHFPMTDVRLAKHP